MTYSLLGSVSSFENYWWGGGGGGTTSISYSAKVCNLWKSRIKFLKRSLFEERSLYNNWAIFKSLKPNNKSTIPVLDHFQFSNFQAT